MNSDEFAELAGMIARARENAARALEDQRTPEAIAATKHRRRRRRLAALTVTFVVVVATGIYVPLTLLAPVGESTALLSDLVVQSPAAVELVLPDIGAGAVSLTGAEEFEGTIGVDGILASSGGAGPRPIASITKLITALVILDAKPLGPTDAGPTLHFSKADADLYDKYYVMSATVHSMRTGSSMSQRDALEVMLIVSATNYADVVSRWAFGSHANFRHATQKWLAAHGLTGTTIVEPTGIDPRNTSTPADLIAIGKLAMADPVVAEIVGSTFLDVPKIGGRPNTNRLIGVDGINGIKTGTLDAAGACLLFSAVMDVGAGSPITVIGVVLGGASRGSVDEAVRALLASIRSGFHEVPLITEGQVLGTYLTPWGDEATIVAGDDASVFTWSDLPITSSVVTRPVETAPAGFEVGVASFTAGSDTATVPLVLDGEIEGPDAWWRLTHPGELLGR